MNQVKRGASALVEAWQRLEAVCRRLWEENSPSAVEAQAIFEEFKGEVARADAQSANSAELRAHDLREHEQDLAELRRQYEMELAGLKRRLELHEQTLREKDARVDDLLKTVASKEEQNLEFHAQVLKMSAASDETKAKKMEQFYQDLMKKEESLGDVWQQRHKALEEEHEHLRKILAAKQAELDAWEQRRVTEEESLKKRQTEHELKSQQLASEYRKKQQEIEDLKASLQRSVTELVRQYQARLRGGADAPTPPPAPR
ncbi:MAG: hypothetical protein KGM24_03740 [Elusimicrobia bacterium]|nr:hypothetical protein [Elusimicrobiota bacterium]